MRRRKMKPTIPVWNIPAIEKKIRILTRAELKTFNKFTIERWNKECLEYLLASEQYERAAELRDANERYVLQMQTGSTTVRL